MKKYNLYKLLNNFKQTFVQIAPFGIIWILLVSVQLNAQDIKGDTILLHDAVKLLSDYVKINSETGNEEKAALFFAEKCNASGLHIEFFRNDTRSYNFIASIYPLSDRKPNIVFLNHLDVVGPGVEKEWKYPPYSGAIIDNKVWGRGAFDNKGLAVIQLYSVLRLLKKSQSAALKYNVSILCVSGEEIGGEKGSGLVASEFIKEINPLVMLGEGGSGFEELSFIPKGKTMFGISIAEKGLLRLKLTTDVTSNGHSSIVGADYANKRLVNAIHKIINWNQKIELTKEATLMFKDIGEIIGGAKGFGLRNINCFLFKSALKRQLNLDPEIEGIFKNTITFTNFINVGNNNNLISQSAEANLDCRLLPGSSVNHFIKNLKEKIKDTTIKVEIMNRYQESYTSMPDFYFEQLSIAIKNTFNNAEVVPILFPAYNDNTFFRKYGCPTFGINPMIVSKEQLESVHNKNEFIDFDDIIYGISVFTQFVEQVLKNSTNIQANLNH